MVQTLPTVKLGAMALIDFLGPLRSQLTRALLATGDTSMTCSSFLSLYIHRYTACIILGAGIFRLPKKSLKFYYRYPSKLLFISPDKAARIYSPKIAYSYKNIMCLITEIHY